MTAPALVLLGASSPDPQVAQVSTELRRRLLAIRPELTIESAYLAPNGSPSRARTAPLAVVERLVAAGATEIVFVPLLLSDAFHTQPELSQLLSTVPGTWPGVRVLVSRPIGPELQLLSVIDRRLRDALRMRRVSELDGLVFAAAGSNDVRSNALVARRARQWATHHRLPCVTAFATGSGPSTAEAIRTLRGQGRRHVAVGSWFLSPGSLYTHQAALALEAGAIAVSAPLGGESEIAEVVLTRYVVSAMELVDLDNVVVVEIEDDVDLDADFAPVRHLSVVSA